eukprot:7077163-Pyramimonas_sp.AAC.1
MKKCPCSLAPAGRARRRADHGPRHRQQQRRPCQSPQHHLCQCQRPCQQRPRAPAPERWP